MTLLADLLHLFKHIIVDNALVGIGENRLLFNGIIPLLLIPDRIGVSLDCVFMVFCLCGFSATPPAHFSSPICARRSVRLENPGCSKGYIFTFRLNIQGAAIATMLSNLIATGYFLGFLCRIRKNTVITPSLKAFSIKQHIPAEVLSVGLPGFVMTMMSTVSNGALNHMAAGYSDTAIAGMGIAKKIDLLAYAIAQGMTQGTLPLIGYNYTSGSHKRMKAAIKTAFAYSFLIACAGAILLWTLAAPISRCFIADAETVGYGQHFLKIICLACPTTAVNFMVITVFQAIGKKVQPLCLSLLRKGSLDVVFMVILNHAVGVSGIA